MDSRLGSNQLLAALPAKDFELLASYSKTITFEPGDLLIGEGEEVTNVFFPHSGMLSIQVVMRDGRAVETSLVGREGVVGAMAALGLHNSFSRVVAHVPLTVSQISAARMRRIASASTAVRDLCVQFNEKLLSQAQITAACNVLHTLDQRFCRWLLQSTNRTQSNEVHLTQDQLAGILGVTRTSVTEVARKMLGNGAISYARGKIAVLDRKMLAANGCECYRMERNS